VTEFWSPETQHGQQLDINHAPKDNRWEVFGYIESEICDIRTALQ
jgi:hypothetical protein